MENKLKLVVVGDTFTGKTSLLVAYTKKQFLDHYSTTVFDNWAVSVHIDQRNYAVSLFDTAGQGNYEKIRCLSYPHANVFLVCFSMTDRKTLESCRTIWIPEIRKYAGDNVPIMLVGTKNDLVETSDLHNVVTEDYAKKVAHEIGCHKFFSCSALTHKGLKRVFDESFLAAVGVKFEEEKPNPCCTIL
uniref:Rho family small GTPase n=1 Tax=Caenorhabditis tropicalis TaxID=1561998 RepID=A0A1I7U6Z7_9PELO